MRLKQGCAVTLQVSLERKLPEYELHCAACYMRLPEDVRFTVVLTRFQKEQ